jgi:hypothetical protein
MPYQSDAQRRKFHELVKQGKMSAATVAEWDRASVGMKLPERVKKKPKKNK